MIVVELLGPSVQIGRSQQWIDGRARHPGQGGRRDDVKMAAGQSQIRLRRNGVVVMGRSSSVVVVVVVEQMGGMFLFEKTGTDESNVIEEATAFEFEGFEIHVGVTSRTA